MDFKRTVNQNLLDYLNDLYENDNSWWRQIVDDDDVFILIRNNRLHVLVNGGLLLEITMDSSGKLTCRTHEEFLSLRSGGNPYTVLTDDETTTPKKVEGLKGLAKHYELVKRRIKLFTGKEKQAVQDVVLKHKQFIDVEIGLEGDKRKMLIGKALSGSIWQRYCLAGCSCFLRSNCSIIRRFEQRRFLPLSVN